MQADVLVFHHHPSGGQIFGNVEVLFGILRRCQQALSQVFLFGVGREGDAVHRADVYAGVALDAELLGEDRLHVAVQAALGFLQAQPRIETQFHLDLDVVQRLRLVGVGHDEALRRIVFRIVAPLMHAHLLADEIHAGRRAILLQILPLAEQVNGNGRLMGMGGGPNDVLRPERRIASEEHLRMGGLKRHFVQHRAIPLVELQAHIALDPRAVVLLADGHQHVIALHVDVRLASGHVAQPTAIALHRLHAFEDDALELAVLVNELLGRAIVDDGYALRHGIFLLPLRRLHHLEGRTHHHRHALRAEPLGGAAAVHGGIAAAHDDDLAGNGMRVAERDAAEPVDADGDVRVHLLTPRQVEIAPAWRPGAHEVGVVVHIEHFLHARDLVAVVGVDPHIDDQIHLFFQHVRWQAKGRNLAAHHAAAGGVAIVHVDFVAEGQ